ncbi:hypothetical protein EVAR_99698_1 [Eumeta japonica]|uniref:Uncharacterized protein n=1 Tax=Eumeta variegata TaxID=151549 RepID=A0A4C1YHV8_EUMVA|nr:hypothetical protein EVAR_99698_1 [Eumeta japonica]
MLPPSPQLNNLLPTCASLAHGELGTNAQATVFVIALSPLKILHENNEIEKGYDMKDINVRLEISVFANWQQKMLRASLRIVGDQRRDNCQDCRIHALMVSPVSDRMLVIILPAYDEAKGQEKGNNVLNITTSTNPMNKTH